MSGSRLLKTTALLFVPVLAGCVVFKAPPKGKQIDADTVRVTFTVCASSPDTGTCPDTGNSGEDSDAFDANILLLGLRVPIGARLPDELRPVTTDVQGVVRRSRQYSRVLNDEAPTPVGFKWVGYRSGVKVTNPEDAAKFRVDIGLPRGFNGSRFRFRPVVGYFAPDDEHPANSPIVCGEALFDDDANDDAGDRVCIDSPTPDESATHIAIPLG